MSDYRQGLLEAARDLSRPADVQIARHPQSTPETLVVAFDRLDLDENRVHLSAREQALLDDVMSMLDSFNPAARTANLWFVNDWMRDPCWAPVRVAADRLARALSGTEFDGG
jgi:hypothetical protein